MPPSEPMLPSLSVVIPTYGRDAVLVDTIAHLLRLAPAPLELIVVDQTRSHAPDAERHLSAWSEAGRIDWLCRSPPSIPAAMNAGLVRSRGELVLFLDDDIVPDAGLFEAHRRAHADARHAVVAGRVLQPWHVDGSAPLDGFASEEPGEVSEFMGGNFSIRRATALAIGGFDERFVGVAYRFEAELAARVRASGATIAFEPRACLHHLKSPSGGTRVHGDHLRTARPMHTVGAYYYLLRAQPRGWLAELACRPLKSVATRHHARRPWWLVPSLAAELAGIAWALVLLAKGPKLLDRT